MAYISIAMLAIFLAALANVIGLGVIVPLLPYFALHHGAEVSEAAWLFSVFSLAQFLTAPLWGRLSDRIGRKPIIIMSFAGSAISYLWLAFAQDLIMIYLSRIFAGAMNGWLATSQAYVSDVTNKENRAKGMGFLGAAFGLGFVIGPALGGYLAGDETVNYQLPILVAANTSIFAMLIAIFMLIEPKRHKDCQQQPTLNVSDQLWNFPILRRLILLYFALFFVFSSMESTLALWCEEVLDMGPRQVGYFLAFAGICGVIIQGGFVGRLAALFGEIPLILFGLLTLSIGLITLPMATEQIGLLLPIALISIGFGFSNPSFQSLISQIASHNSRGSALGIAQSANSLGRIAGPAWGGFSFASIGADWPFISGAAGLMPVFIVTLMLASHLKSRK